MARHVLTNTAKASVGAQGDLHQQVPHHDVGSAKPLKDVDPYSPSVTATALCSLLRVLWAVLVSPLRSNQGPAKEKCQDNQNGSLGDPVLGTEPECGHHSSDLCSAMFSVCFPHRTHTSPPGSQII